MADLEQNRHLKRKFSEFFYQGSIYKTTIDDFPEFHADLSRYKEMGVYIVPVTKKTPTFFDAILRPFSPGCQNFNT